MIDTIYVEEAVREHATTLALRARFPAAHVIPCAHHGAVFNRTAQNFRLQKQRPALIVARKDNRRVLPVPPGYGFDNTAGFYFSHALNCLYDCRYCFLQGMFRSAHYVLFVNYDDFLADIRAHAAARDQPTWFFSGYDCDSLALEPITGFARHFVPAIDEIPHAWLELRTKSTQIRSLLALQPRPRTVCAFSLSPDVVARRLEHRAPGLQARLDAAARLAAAGWHIGLRFDPLVAMRDFETVYRDFFAQVAAHFGDHVPHSITLGPLRLPRDFLQRMTRLYPDEPLFATGLETSGDSASYAPALQRALLDFCTAELRQRFGGTPVYRQGEQETA